MSRYERAQVGVLRSRLAEPRRFLQVVIGPRQVGKTTMVQQAIEGAREPITFLNADEPTLQDAAWLARRWEASRAQGGVLIVDEVQKVAGWSETVKRLWDEDSRNGSDLRVVLLGSAPLLLQQGLSESLAGRFELIRVSHWSMSEMRDAFGWDLERYIFSGGYPGSVPLVDDHERWVRYLRDALIETTISRDVLLLTRVDKPALLRRLFDLGCRYSGQILSYNKMLGQLQDAGNTTTLAHYLDLLDAAGMLVGLQKFAGQAVRRRGSSPKLIVRNTALATAVDGRSFELARADRTWWGRLTESSVGAHLLNATVSDEVKVTYWNEGDREVDFILEHEGKTTAIEVKSGRDRRRSSIAAFAEAFDARTLLVGGDGIAIDRFLASPPMGWVA